MTKDYYLYSVLFSIFIGWISHSRETSMPIIEIGAVSLLMLPFSLLFFYLFFKFVKRNKD